jgi:hypothetical protein
MFLHIYKSLAYKNAGTWKQNITYAEKYYRCVCVCVCITNSNYERRDTAFL